MIIAKSKEQRKQMNSQEKNDNVSIYQKSGHQKSLSTFVGNINRNSSFSNPNNGGNFKDNSKGNISQSHFLGGQNTNKPSLINNNISNVYHQKSTSRNIPNYTSQKNRSFTGGHTQNNCNLPFHPPTGNTDNHLGGNSISSV